MVLEIDELESFKSIRETAAGCLTIINDNTRLANFSHILKALKVRARVTYIWSRTLETYVTQGTGVVRLTR